MKLIILPSTILDFTWVVNNGFMEENSLVPHLPQKKLGPPATNPLSYKIRKKILTLTEKRLWGEEGGEYIPWEIRIQIQTNNRKLLGQGNKSEKLYKLKSESFSVHFVFREFSSPTWKKSPPSKVPILTQNPNLTSLYKPSQKWFNFLHHPGKKGGRGVNELWDWC